MAIRRYGQGKFDTIIDSYVYDLSLARADDEAGDVSEIGIWHALFRGAFKVGGRLSDFTAEQLRDMTAEEKRFLAKQKGAIIYENDQGFVNVDYFTDAAALKEEWEAIQADVADFYEQDESDE